MPHERYFYPEKIKAGVIELTGDEFFHLSKVMRQREGDTVELVNGMGTFAKGVVEKLGKRECQIAVESVVEEEAVPGVILAQSLPRLPRLETIVEKGCELGMSELWLFAGMKSEKRELNKKQWERLGAIMIAAMKQCGRLWLPKICWKPVVQEWDEKLTGYFGDLNEKAPWLGDVFRGETGIVFAVGPESGFTNKEEDKLRELGLKGVKLSRHILRTDTAAIAVPLAILGAANFEK